MAAASTAAVARQLLDCTAPKAKAALKLPALASELGGNGKSNAKATKVGERVIRLLESSLEPRQHAGRGH